MAAHSHRKFGSAGASLQGEGEPASNGAERLHSAPPFDAWQWMQACSETWSAGLDPAGIGRRLRERRLQSLIDTALRDSPLYRRRARGARCLADFEPVGKAELMREFDSWSTDRRITRPAVDAFTADPACVADAWLDNYLVWTSSGTSGYPGVFVQDSASLAAYDAIDTLRLRGGGPMQPTLGLWGLGRTFAFVGATGGHFAGHVSIERLRRIVPAGLAPAIHVISVLEPLPQVAMQLQAIRPAVLITYPSCATALAQMQLSGALRIGPAEIWLGGEQLSAAQRRLLTEAFDCTIRNAYGASEFYSIAFECGQGRLHVNDDWLILEAMDSGLRPLPAGEMSQVTLLTNLANRTQPLLRYRLDDRVRFVPGACPCGSAFPVIEVQGRADDTLHLPGRGASTVTILPLALETAIEEDAQVTQFQVLCHPGGRLELRLEPVVPDAATASRRCRRAIVAYLAGQGLADTHVATSAAAPLRQRGGGKIRRVIDVAQG